MVPVALIFAAVAGCTQTAGRFADSTQPFSRFQIINTVGFGYGRIVEQALEPVPLHRMAMDGMRGLASIDPSIVILSGGGAVNLWVNGEILARFDLPTPGDSNGWARITADVAEKARQRSADLRKANLEQILEVIFDGALGVLDACSRYAGRDEARATRAKRDGFGGIGVMFRVMDGAAWVFRVIPGTPAAKAGIRPADAITHVGGVSLQSLDAEAIQDQLQGPLGSKVRLTIIRHSKKEAIHAEVIRTRIIPPTVTSKMEQGVAVLGVGAFNQDTSAALIRHLNRLKNKADGALDGIILDLRGNPGGLLSEAVKMSDLFLSHGGIVSTEGRHWGSLQRYRASANDITHGLPLAVLIDGRSASAAEVVAAALQDAGRAVVVGSVSYGKGTVQTLLRLPNGGQIALTWSRLIAPSGYALHKVGVLPTVCTISKDFPDRAAKAFSGGGKMAKYLDARRQVLIRGGGARKALRKACPPQPRFGPADMNTALFILRNPKLLHKAIIPAFDHLSAK